MYAVYLFGKVIAFITNMLPLRRSCCVWQCSKDLQSHNALWVTPCWRWILFLLCIPLLFDGQEWFKCSLYLAFRLLRYRWYGHLVWHWSDIS